jgi:hypothetical protein
MEELELYTCLKRQDLRINCSKFLTKIIPAGHKILDSTRERSPAYIIHDLIHLYLTIISAAKAASSRACVRVAVEDQKMCISGLFFFLAFSSPPLLMLLC